MASLNAKERAYLDACIILVDSREQKPWTFSSHETERVGIKVGDYSIRDADGRSWAPGEDNAIMIERKSLDDLAGSFTGEGRRRFADMWIKGQELMVQHMALIIEGTWPDICAGRWHSRVKAESIKQSLHAWGLSYNFEYLPISRDRQMCADACMSILEKHVTQILRRER